MVIAGDVTLEDYMTDNVAEEFNPFYINYFKNGSWTNGGNRFKMQQQYGLAYNDKEEDTDYFVVAVKQGFKVQIAIENSNYNRWNGLDLPTGWDRESIGIGGNQFLRFTMTGGGFLEIAGGAGSLRPIGWSKLEEQLDNDGMQRALQEQTIYQGLNDPPSIRRVRFSADGHEWFHYGTIKEKDGHGNVMAIILDGITLPTYDPEDEAQPTEEQTIIVPEGETATTKDDLGEWETIHDWQGSNWAIVDLKSSTDGKTWAFFFNGLLISAFAEKNDALIALNFHFEKYKIENIDNESTYSYDTSMAFLFSAGLFFATRWLGRFLI